MPRATTTEPVPEVPVIDAQEPIINPAALRELQDSYTFTMDGGTLRVEPALPRYPVDTMLNQVLCAIAGDMRTLSGTVNTTHTLTRNLQNIANRVPLRTLSRLFSTAVSSLRQNQVGATVLTTESAPVMLIGDMVYKLVPESLNTYTPRIKALKASVLEAARVELAADRVRQDTYFRLAAEDVDKKREALRQERLNNVQPPNLEYDWMYAPGSRQWFSCHQVRIHFQTIRRGRAVYQLPATHNRIVVSRLLMIPQNFDMEQMRCFPDLPHARAHGSCIKLGDTKLTSPVHAAEVIQAAFTEINYDSLLAIPAECPGMEKLPQNQTFCDAFIKEHKLQQIMEGGTFQRGGF